MPLYDFQCSECKILVDHQCLIADRLEPIDCPDCGEKSSCTVFVGAAIPHHGTERRVGSNRIIHSEAEVASELGTNWRDAGTTGKEGGCGAKEFFHR